MRWVLAACFAIHGIAHLPGFTTPWRITTSAALPYQTTILAGAVDLGPIGVRLLGVAWLAVAVALVGTGVAVARSVPGWIGPALAVLAVSTALCLVGWPATPIGLAGNLIMAGVLGLGWRGGWLPNAGVQDLSLEALWRSAPPSLGRFDPAQVAGLPEPARRYLLHAIAPGTPLATAVRLTMHGEIKLGATWRRFQGEQVIVQGRGMIWAARVPMLAGSIVGSDRIVDGVGGMRWRLGGLVPVMSGTGADVTRSAAGRLAGEAIWLPGWLVDPAVEWRAEDGDRAGYRLTIHGETVGPVLTVGPDGRVTAVRLLRWGNPEGGACRYHEFGVEVEEEGTFGGYTLPTRIRAGWCGGGAGLDGEFFRMSVDKVAFAPATPPHNAGDRAAAIPRATTGRPSTVKMLGPPAAKVFPSL